MDSLEVKENCKKFDEIYRTPSSHSAVDRQLTRRSKQAKLKPPFKSLSSKCWQFIFCSYCGKERAIVFEEKTQKRRQSFGTRHLR